MSQMSKSKNLFGMLRLIVVPSIVKGSPLGEGERGRSSATIYSGGDEGGADGFRVGGEAKLEAVAKLLAGCPEPGDGELDEGVGVADWDGGTVV